MARKSNGGGLHRFGGANGSASTMVPLAELTHQTVSFEVADKGTTHRVVVQRFKSGQVGMSCDCADAQGDGWCTHRVDLLCGRYAGIVDGGKSTAAAFRQIVGGTLLADDASNLDALLVSFNASLAAFDAERPRDITGNNLSIFTELVSDLAAASAELEDAVGRVRRRFDVGNGLLERTKAPALALAPA